MARSSVPQFTQGKAKVLPKGSLGTLERDGQAADQATIDAYQADQERRHQTRLRAKGRKAAEGSARRAPAAGGAVGARRRTTAARAVGVSGPKLGRQVGGAADEGAGFLLGLVGAALLLAYLRGGPAGAKAWLRAKFTNVPAAPAASAPSSAAPARPAQPAAAGARG